MSHGVYSEKKVCQGGQVDFPSGARSEQWVFLPIGEMAIAAWHTFDASVADLKPITESRPGKGIL
jgi:hypothetical protein